MTNTQKEQIKKLVDDIYSNCSFAVQNAENGHEKATIKYSKLSQEAYYHLLKYIDSI